MDEELAKEVLSLIKHRRSIRKYLDVPVEWDKIVALLEAGRWAPSAGNLNECHFIIVTDPDVKKKVAEACLQQYWIEHAPALIVITSMEEKVRQYYGEYGGKYVYEDAAAVAENMLIMATALDLGSCWIGGFDEQGLSEALGIPGHTSPIVVLAFGYADEKVPVPPRKDLETQAYLQAYGGKVKNANLVLWDWSLEMERHAKKAKEGVKKGLQKLADKVKEKKQK